MDRTANCIKPIDRNARIIEQSCVYQKINGMTPNIFRICRCTAYQTSFFGEIQELYFALFDN